MNNQYFVKFMEHSDEFYSLIAARPTAFCLLAILVDRARKSVLEHDDGLSIGEAFTGAGDADRYGVGRQKYRTDLKFLQKIGQISTIRSTSQGTVIKIYSSAIFDISRNKLTTSLTTEQPATNQELTTKQEVRREKEYKNTKKLGKRKSFGSQYQGWNYHPGSEPRPPYQKKERTAVFAEDVV